MGTIPDAIDHGPVPLRPHPSSIIREDFTPSALSYFSGRGAPLQCRPLSLAGELMGLTYVPTNCFSPTKTATAGSDVVQSGRPIFNDFFQHLWPYIGNNRANVVFQMVKRLWLIRID
ncbi:hypothetical protein TNCV_678631 [Trichonephila clavipes]|nr:hypothetical protein TNCV_678631 [Trichonephila clavipes]